MVSLPTPEQTGIGEEATLEANKAVESLLSQQQNGGKRKRKPYRRFSDTDRAVIGKYAAEHGNAKAMKKFKQEFPELPESTVRSFKIKYTQALESGQSPGEAIEKIPSKRRGRPKLLGDYDTQVQQFVKALQHSGTVVTPQVVIAAAEGIVSANNKELLASNGGNVNLKKTWAVSLMKRVGLRKSRGSKDAGNASTSSEDDTSCIGQILKAISTHSIPLELVIGWEQFDLPLVPDGYSGGNEGDDLGGGSGTRSIVGVIGATMSGSILPFQLVYDGDSEDCRPSFSFPSDFSIFHHPRQSSSKESIQNFITKIVLPYVRKVRCDKGLKATHPAILIHQALTDGEEEVLSLLQDNSILPITLPSDYTECDITFPIFQFIEEHLTEKFKSWYSDEVKQQLDRGKRVEDISIDLQYGRLKELQAMWLVSAFECVKANPNVMTSGFEKSGIINPSTSST